MITPKVLQDLMKPITSRNDYLANESKEEKLTRIKNKFGLHHGKKKQKNKKKK